MASLSELRQRLLHRYYVIHSVYGITYIIVLLRRALVSQIPWTDSERNAYIALVALSAWKCVMASTAEELTSVLILYTKFFSLCMLYWKTSFWRPLLYIVGWISISTLFPQPWYQGPTKIEELTEDRFRKQVQRKNAPKITNVEDEPPKYWIVMMYANWSVACLNFEAVLAKLSLEYSADHVKFGKIDVDIYGDIAQEFGISRDPASFDLPTLILFRDGASIRRLPELTPTNDTGSNASASTTAKDTITRIGWNKRAATVVKTFHLDSILADKK